MGNTLGMMNEVIKYILTFLLHGNEEATATIGYTADPTLWNNYKLVIIPNGSLGKDWPLPDMRPPTAVGLPDSKTRLIDVDVVYNTLFFISRAEETLTDRRDEHGRFTAACSMLGQGNRLMIPLVDEYSRLLCKTLQLPMPEAGFAKINLTHDIDTLGKYHSLRGLLGGIKRGEWHEVWQSLKDIEKDPDYSFPWFIRQDKRVAGAQVIYFAKDTTGRSLDYPQYDLNGSDWQHTRQMIEQSGAIIGLHSSCNGSYLPSHDRGGINRQYHRSHYLNCSIQRMQQLADAGVRDDYTMGFPDRIGFRLQTTRPVRWFNPITMTLTNLTMHPLMVMDVTLHSERYMHLSEDEAYFLCQELFERVSNLNGELTLLWHNSNINNNTYHKDLYPKLLQLL